MSTARLDALLEMQHDSQEYWEREHVFEVDAPADFDAEAADKAGAAGTPVSKKKFMVTFPYPYMNGRLHIGHLFTVTKAEFAAGFHRQLGYDVIFPFGLHCTGMPIKAAADRLAQEIELFAPYGSEFPPTEEMFAQYKADRAAAEAEAAEATKATADADAEAAAAAAAEAEAAAAGKKQFKSKRSKLAAKSGDAKFQFEIMRMSGVADSEIRSFADPRHWIYHFPALCVEDMKEFGARVDWRRSFITTDANAYYDSFVRWQFTMLKDRQKIRYGKRFCIYSPLDGQPCADHERSVGEGVGMMEYTVIKMRVAHEDLPPVLRDVEALKGKEISLGAATLRPETMYGQTNAWALPDGKYGVYEITPGECMVMGAEAARAFAFQDYTTSGAMGEPVCLAHLTGRDLIGTRVTSPLAPAPVYVLPLLTISMTKGTGIVTSVPADAPDDFAALVDLRTKPELRAEYNVDPAWLGGEGDEVLEIIEIAGLPGAPVPGAKKGKGKGKAADVPTVTSTRSAPYMCAHYKVRDQHDRAHLDLAKGVCYSKGFRDGVLLVGPHAGERVEDAKDIVKAEMLAAGDAILYCEPESPVVSRSGDTCVVARVSQWYLDYGEPVWRGEVEDYVRNELGVNDATVRNLFLDTVAWLRQWSCSREFGLGTKMPFDERYLVESLSDSTLYMAFYTVCHLLMSSTPLDGSTRGPLDIPAEALTPAVWSALFFGEQLPADSQVTPAQFARLRREFVYWYPMDLRVSGKDLIRNHLTMCLYNHAAAFPERRDLWPRAYRSNGFLLVDNEKMSKSKGNFFSAVDVVRKYSSDAVRAAMAEASDDPVSSANFSQSVAASYTTKLGMLNEFYVRAAAALADPAAAQLRAADEPLTAVDAAFASTVNQIIEDIHADYTAAAYSRVSANVFARLISARNAWLQRTFDQVIPTARGFVRDRRPENFAGLHAGLLRAYLETQARLLAPICPHSAEYWWRKVLNNEGSIHDAGWPAPWAVPDAAAAAATATFLDSVLTWAAELYNLAKTGKAGLRKGQKPVPQVVKGLTFHIATELPDYCSAVIAALQGAYDAEAGDWTDKPMKIVSQLMRSGAVEKVYAKRASAFAVSVVNDVNARGAEGFNFVLPFNQEDVLRSVAGYLKVSFALDNIEFTGVKAGSDTLPGRPQLVYVTEPETAE